MRQAILEILQRLRPEIDFPTVVDYVGEGALDSLDIVTLVAELDREFSVSIPGVEIVPENFRNLDTLCALVARSPARRQ